MPTRRGSLIGPAVTLRCAAKASTLHRCSVEWLTKGLGIQGIIRGKPHRTTIPDRSAPRPQDGYMPELSARAAQLTGTERPMLLEVMGGPLGMAE